MDRATQPCADTTARPVPQVPDVENTAVRSSWPRLLPGTSVACREPWTACCTEGLTHIEHRSVARAKVSQTSVVRIQHKMKEQQQ